MGVIRFDRAMCLAVAFASPAWAQPAGGVRLEYRDETGSTSCPPEAEFREIVAARLGRVPFEETGTSTMRIALVRDGHNVEIRAELLDPAGASAGDRVFTGALASCTDLAESVALAVAVVIDPLAAGAEPPPPDPVPPMQVTVNVTELPEPDPVPAPEPPEPPPPGLRAEVGVLATGRLLRAPLPTLGASVQGGVRFEAWSIFARAEMAQSVVDAQTDRGDRIANALYGGSLGACGHYEILVGCVSVLLGAFQSLASTVATPAQVVSFFAEADLAAGVDVGLLPWLDLRAVLDAGVPLVHIDLAIDGRTVFALPVASLGVSLGLIARLG